MKDILFFLLPISLLMATCSPVKKAGLSMVPQGINGTITVASGNQMPMKGAPPRVPRGLACTVLVYEPTNISQVRRISTSPMYTAINTRLVASVNTDSTGHFSVSLPVGSYSLFILQGKEFYANLFDANNNIALFTVEKGKITRANLVVSEKAAY